MGADAASGSDEERHEGERAEEDAAEERPAQSVVACGRTIDASRQVAERLGVLERIMGQHTSVAVGEERGLHVGSLSGEGNHDVHTSSDALPAHVIHDAGSVSRHDFVDRDGEPPQGHGLSERNSAGMGVLP